MPWEIWQSFWHNLWFELLWHIYFGYIRALELYTNITCKATTESLHNNPGTEAILFSSIDIWFLVMQNFILLMSILNLFVTIHISSMHSVSMCDLVSKWINVGNWPLCSWLWCRETYIYIFVTLYLDYVGILLCPNYALDLGLRLQWSTRVISD
jgi:hypothetical protein